MCLSLPDLDNNINDLKESSICISKSIKENNKDNKVFNFLLPKLYFIFKEILKKLQKLKFINNMY